MSKKQKKILNEDTDYQDSCARIEVKDLSMCSSSTNVKSSDESLIEGKNSVITEKVEFIYRDISKLTELSGTFGLSIF